MPEFTEQQEKRYRDDRRDLLSRDKRKQLLVSHEATGEDLWLYT